MVNLVTIHFFFVLVPSHRPATRCVSNLFCGKVSLLSSLIGARRAYACLGVELRVACRSR